MQAKAYYTVIASQGGFIVKFAEPPDYQVSEFEGKFYNAGDAKRALKKLERFQLHEYLSKAAFEQKVRACQADLARLRSWNTGGTH